MAHPSVRYPVGSPFVLPAVLDPLLLRRHAGSGRDLTVERRSRWLTAQVLVMLAAVAAYFLVRGATEAKTGEAVRNAARLVRFERLLGLDHEWSLQAVVLPHEWLTTAFTKFYIFGHWPVIAVTLVWLALRSPTVFARTRNAMLLSGSVGLVIFLSLPVAPPRLAGIGLVDTVDEQSHAYRVLQPAAFTNQYAALPSLHVGWNLLMGLALYTAARHWLARLLAVLGPLVMATAVVVTANHYLVDVIAGAGIATAAWLFAGVMVWRRSDRAALRPDDPALAVSTTKTPPGRPETLGAGQDAEDRRAVVTC